jgi:hypothetical protein
MKKREKTELLLKNILSLFTDESCAKRVFINNFKQKKIKIKFHWQFRWYF